MRPTVVAPQMKNDPASARKTRSRPTPRRTPIAAGRDAAVGRGPDVLGRVVQRGAHGDEPEHRRAAHHDHRRAPVPVGDEVRHQREEDELAGGVGRGEQADDQAPALREPAPGYGRGEDGRDRAGGGAGHEPPHHVELPQLGDLGQGRRREHDEPERHRDHPAQAEALVERGRERRAQAEDDEVDRGGGGDRAVAPAELVHERLHEDPERRADRRGGEQGDEGGGGDDPGAVHAGEHRGRSLRAVVAGKTMCANFLP
jgi:hypothetical protein